MTWRITASIHESSFGDSDVAIEANLRAQFADCVTRAPHHLPGVEAAERILVGQGIALAKAVCGVLPGSRAAINGGRTFQFYAQGAGGLIDEIGLLTVVETAQVSSATPKEDSDG